MSFLMFNWGVGVVGRETDATQNWITSRWLVAQQKLTLGYTLDLNDQGRVKCCLI